ncbi:MAG: hypothetical protein HY216_09860 [Candidatus Rokubacteria bacterium]|nr:hypothetical protein [Candidatus Rokubacteria bacterium]
MPGYRRGALGNIRVLVAVVSLFTFVVSGQIKLRRIDGRRKIAAVRSQHTAVAA